MTATRRCSSNHADGARSTTTAGTAPATRRRHPSIAAGARPSNDGGRRSTVKALAAAGCGSVAWTATDTASSMSSPTACIRTIALIAGDISSWSGSSTTPRRLTICAGFMRASIRRISIPSLIARTCFEVSRRSRSTRERPNARGAIPTTLSITVEVAHARNAIGSVAARDTGASPLVHLHPDLIPNP